MKRRPAIVKPDEPSDMYELNASDLEPVNNNSRKRKEKWFMDFFNSAIDVLQTLVIALGGGLCVWGGINLLEGYGQDNPAAKSQGVKQFMAN